MRPFFAYLLKCSDGSYYAGHTDDMDLRMRQHIEGASGYTSTRRPLELVWQGEFESRHGALEFEMKIKGWSRAKKEALIAGDWEQIKVLARSGTLRQAQGERSRGQAEGERALRQAQGERSLGQAEGERALRQAQGERGLGRAAGERALRQAQGERNLDEAEFS